MATDLRNLPPDIGTDANFRLWGVGLTAQFAAVGLVKTADTGQINWSTVLTPTAGNQKRGYEIWRFNDALQATKPVFIRFDYGSGAATTYPGIWAQIGTGTDGAGNLTGQVGAQRQTQPGQQAPSSYCSGSSSRLNLMTSYGTVVGSMAMICIERTKTGAGVDTGDGIVCTSYYGGGSLLYQLVPFIGTILTTSANNPSLDPNSGGLSAVGTDVMLSPTVVFYGKPLFASWCSYKNSEITALTPITFTHLGATRTYMPFGLAAAASGLNLASVSSGLAMLWE